MTVQEYILRLKAVKTELDNTRESTAMLISQDVLALQKSRIINTGKDDEGKKIGDYSKKVVPVWMYEKKEKRVSNAVEKLRKKKGNFASYADWREVNNLPIEFKNFSFTNQMWSSIVAYVAERTEKSVTVGYTANNEKALTKLRYVIDKHPDLFDLSQTEENLLVKAQENRILGVLKKWGVVN